MPLDAPACPVTAHAAPDATHLRVWQGYRELSIERARPGQQAFVRSASGQLAERREQMAVAPRCRYQVRRSRWPSPVGRERANQLRQVVGLSARIDGVVVAVDGVVGQDAHIATVRAERERVVLRDAAECREWPQSRRRAAVHWCSQVPAEMQMPRRRTLRRHVGARQIAVARLDRTREFLTLPRIAVEDDRAVAVGRACPLDKGMLPRHRRRRAPGPHAVLRAFADEGMVMRVAQAASRVIRWARTSSGWCRSGVLGFCCSRIGLGASNTRPLSRPKARASKRGLFLVRPTYTTTAPCLAGFGPADDRFA